MYRKFGSFVLECSLASRLRYIYVYSLFSCVFWWVMVLGKVISGRICKRLMNLYVLLNNRPKASKFVEDADMGPESA